MGILLFIGIAALILGAIFKVSINIMKLLFGFVGIILAIMVLPMALTLIIPLALIALGVGLAKFIF